jgi:hypothetical protein
VASTVVHRERSALQSQLVERLRPQLPGDAANVVKAVAHRLAGLGVLQPEHHAGENLAHLVVQLARNPAAHLLLGGHHPAPALAALVLQAVEHVVEGLGQSSHVSVGVRNGQPASGLARLHRPHRVLEPAKRRDHRTEQDVVEHHRDHEAHHDDHRLGARDGEVDLDG